MNQLYGHYIKQNKQVEKDKSYMICFYELTIDKFVETESKMVSTRLWEGGEENGELFNE